MPNTWALHRTGITPVSDESGGVIQRRVGGHNRRGKVHLGHSVGTRAFIADDDDLAGRNLLGSATSDQGIQGRILRVKHASWPGVDAHLLRHRKGLDHRTARSNVSAKNRNAPGYPEWVGAGPNDFVHRDFVIVQIT